MIIMQNSLLFFIKLTRVLLILCMVLGIYLIYSTVMFRELDINISYRPSVSRTTEQVDDIKPVARESFGSYAEVFSKRDFFNSPIEQYQQRSKPSLEDKPQPVDFDLTTQYRLVGIVLDDNPQAIIEDLIRKETLFLSIGDKLGGAVLKEILPGKARFLFQDNLLELIQ